VEFAKEELDALRTAREKALTIDAFVDPSQIDPIYFDGRVYYLIPSGNSGSEPYALLLTAMERKHRWGVGQVVFSGREQLALIRPRGGLLLMAMLKYEDELRLGRDVGAAIQHSRAGSQSLKLAEALIGQWGTDSFDITQYRDRYREKVQAAISEKQQGHEVAAPQEEEPEVINLMDALKRSVAHAKGAGSAARPSSSSARKPKRKATKPTAKKRTSGRQRRKTA
ncbi:MAG TPA: Ku protein, partial [Pirellulales bacterium]|nr:Ku protein [Pirellulales bacterium]